MQLTLDRRNLSQHVASRLRELITAGRLADGQRLQEVALAEELGVSRTPVREALGVLVAEGFLEQRPRRGVFVRPLDVADFEQIYAVRALLDPGALEAGGLPSPEQLDLLDRLNQQIETEAADPDRVIELDDRWHLLLVEHCRNPVLLDLIRKFMRRTRRYEQAYMRERGHVDVATTEHRKILEALRSGDLRAGCEALRQNLSSAKGPIRRWLESREGASS